MVEGFSLSSGIQWTEHLIKPSSKISAAETFLLPKFPHQENPLIYYKIRAPKFLFFNPQWHSDFC